MTTRIPEPPQEFWDSLKHEGVDGVDVCEAGNLALAGLPPPSHFVFTGRHGVVMHVDPDFPRYSVLLVIVGSYGWILRTWDRKVQDVFKESARRGKVIVCDIHSPHSLHDEDGPDPNGWCGLVWERRTKRGAERLQGQIRFWLEAEKEYNMVPASQRGVGGEGG